MKRTFKILNHAGKCVAEANDSTDAALLTTRGYPVVKFAGRKVWDAKHDGITPLDRTHLVAAGVLMDARLAAHDRERREKYERSMAAGSSAGGAR